MIKVLTVAFFLWSVWDRFKKTFRQKAFSRDAVRASERLNSLLMIAIYAAISLDGFFSFILKPAYSSTLSALSGTTLYLVARAWRNAAMRTLGKQWSMHISAGPISKIIILGPYQYCRHPYYSATVLELVAYTFLFQSLRTGLLTLCVFLPLIFVRILLEERELKEKFAQAFVAYQSHIGILFDFIRFFRDLTLFQDFYQILNIVRRFGFHQLIRIKFMSDSVVRYSRGYAVSRIAGAMIEAGLIESLLQNEQVNLVEFCQAKGFDFDTLRILSDYFSVLGILQKKGFVYRLTPYGKKLFDISRGVFTLLYAYMPVFEALPEIIRREKSYGVDIFRKSDYVGQGSAELAQLLPFPYARDMLKRHNLNRILDLGCGAGDFLIDFCKDNGFVGYGVDISPEVIEVARKHAEIQGMNSQVKFQTGDLRALKELSEEFQNIDVITFMFVLHEFLNHGVDEVVKVLRKVSESFPDKFILITEVCKWSQPKLESHPIPVAEHHLFHRLSRQGLATIQEWHVIFKRAGFMCLEEKRFDRAAQAYFLLKPQSS